jgi:hypothetical protein
MMYDAISGLRVEMNDLIAITLRFDIRYCFPTVRRISKIFQGCARTKGLESAPPSMRATYIFNSSAFNRNNVQRGPS